MCIGVFEYVLQRFTAEFTVFLVTLFDKMLGTSRATSIIVKSRLNLLSYSESQKATIIVAKLMKFTGHLLMVVLIKGSGILKIVIDAYNNRCIYKKTESKLTTPSGVYTLQPHHHKLGRLTQKL